MHSKLGTAHMTEGPVSCDTAYRLKGFPEAFLSALLAFMHGSETRNADVF